jgi:hypothetical protein
MIGFWMDARSNSHMRTQFITQMPSTQKATGWQNQSNNNAPKDLDSPNYKKSTPVLDG